MKTIYDIEEEQAIKFCEVCNEIVEELHNGTFKGKTFEDFKKHGVTGRTLQTLKKNHYVSYHDHKSPVWISWTNKYYEDNTIMNLKMEWIEECLYEIPLNIECNLNSDLTQEYFEAMKLYQAKKEEQELEDILKNL